MRGFQRRTWRAAIAIAITPIAAFGPSGRAFAGPPDVHPVAAGAVATATLTTTDLWMDTIDGENMRIGIDDARARFVVAPGRHQLGISRHFFRGRSVRIRSEYEVVCIDAIAGHGYTLRPVAQIDGSWTTAVFDATAAAPVATTCAPAAGPVVAEDGVADGTATDVSTPTVAPVLAAPQVAVTPGVEDHRPDRPGTGLALRGSLAIGGDTLARGTETTLRAGGGLMIAFAGSFTPFWLRKNFGFGVGLELGFKYDAGANASFGRYPLLVTAHVLARTARRWYVKLAAGIERPFVAHYSSDDVFGQNNLDVQSHLGPAIELGLYRLIARHGALDISLRYSHPRYTFAGVDIDGGSVGVLIGGHYDR